MIGTKFNKNDYDFKKYAECAAWCNEHYATIEDKGEYYECVAIPLDDIKHGKILTLKFIRDAKELQPILYNGYLFDFDKDAIMRMELAERSLRNGGSITWTDANNNRVNGVNADDLNGILNAGTARSNELHIQYNKLKNLVMRAETVEQIEAIEW